MNASVNPIVLNVLAPLVRKAEGLRLLSYKDSAGIWTVGYGHTKDVRSNLQITKDQAETFLIIDMSQAILDTLELCPSLMTASPEKLAAISDFTFNLGAGRLRASTLRRRIEEGRWDQVCQELRRWVYAVDDKDLDGDGNCKELLPLPGLVKRREAECALWSLGDQSPLRSSTHEGPSAKEGV